MKARPASIGLFAVRLLVAAVFLLPILFVVLAAFRPSGVPLAGPLWPAPPTADNFRRLFAALPIGRYTSFFS